MLTCREVTHLVASDTYAKAGMWQRLSIRMHQLMCRHCRHYAEQIRLIGDVARNLGDPQPEDPATLKRLSRSILEQLGGNGDGARRPSDPARDPSG